MLLVVLVIPGLRRTSHLYCSISLSAQDERSIAPLPSLGFSGLPVLGESWRFDSRAERWKVGIGGAIVCVVV